MIGKAILFLGAAALAPTFAALAHAQSNETERPAFVPPDATQVLTRTVRRSLPGGREIVVRRSYRVTFTRDGDGFRVDGELISAEVEAPESVRALAELERNRPDSGLFPILLDAGGRFVLQNRPAADPAVNQGVSLAITRIDESALSNTDRADATGFVRQAALQGGGVAWPSDLFNPTPGNHTEVRKIALPQGGEGEVSISVAAQIDPLRRHLGAFERVVVTRLAGTERQSLERWTMEPLAQALQTNIP